MAYGDLTPKMESYVQGLFRGLSQRKAYQGAYDCSNMSDDVVDVRACELAADGRIKVRLAELQKEVAERAIITKEEVLEELRRMASANATDFVQIERGKVVITPTEDLPMEKRSAIAGIKQTQNGIEVKLQDKKGALELLGKHLGLWTEKLEIEAKIEHGLEDFL